MWRLQKSVLFGYFLHKSNNSPPPFSAVLKVFLTIIQSINQQYLELLVLKNLNQTISQKGIAHKVNITEQFIKRKKEEYEMLQADFISKMSISSKAARESKYWIDLLIKTDYLNINDEHTKSLQKEIEEIIKLLTSIVKSSKEKN